MYKLRAPSASPKLIKVCRSTVLQFDKRCSRYQRNSMHKIPMTIHTTSLTCSHLIHVQIAPFCLISQTDTRPLRVTNVSSADIIPKMRSLLRSFLQPTNTSVTKCDGSVSYTHLTLPTNREV